MAKENKELNKERITQLKSTGYEHMMNIERYQQAIRQSQQVIAQINQQISILIQSGTKKAEFKGDKKDGKNR